VRRFSSGDPPVSVAASPEPGLVEQVRALGLYDARASTHRADCPVCGYQMRFDGGGWVCDAGCSSEVIAAALERLARGTGLAAADGLKVRSIDLARVRAIEWAWRGRLPLGYLCLLLGAEGVGKGTLIAWLVARVTRGELPGDLEREPSRVLLVGDEDAFDSVTVPRLYAAGADLSLVETIDEADDELDIARDAAGIGDLVRERGYRIVILDALLDTLAGDVDDWRSKAVRGALRPMRRMARDLDICILGSLHPNKGARSSFRDLISGTHAFNASSRSSLLLAQHPDDEDRRVLVRGKGNLAATPPSFEFALEGRDVEINGHTFSLPLVTRPDEGSLDVSDLLRPDRPAPVRETLAEKIDAVGTGQIQSRAEIARHTGRDPDDRSVGRALEQLEDAGRWLKEGRGQWRKIGIGTSKDAPMSNRGGGA